MAFFSKMFNSQPLTTGASTFNLPPAKAMPSHSFTNDSLEKKEKELKQDGGKNSKRKRYSKKHVTKRHVSKKPFVWRFIIINGVVKKFKVGKRMRGGNSRPMPITSNSDINQYLLLQPEKSMQGAYDSLAPLPSSIKTGGYCGCNANRAPSTNGDLLTQTSTTVGGMSKKMLAYKKKLDKLSVDKLKKIAANKHIKITKKKNGAITYIKKSSIIRKLCECKKRK